MPRKTARQLGDNGMQNQRTKVRHPNRICCNALEGFTWIVFVMHAQHHLAKMRSSFDLSARGDAGEAERRRSKCALR